MARKPKVSVEVAPLNAEDSGKEKIPRIGQRDQTILLDFEIPEIERDPDYRRKCLALEALVHHGTVTAARRVALASKQEWDSWIAADPKFKECVDTASTMVADELEEEAIMRAKEGSDQLMTLLLKASKPEKYKDRSQQELVGKDGGPIEVASARDKILEKLQKMAERQHQLLPGADNGTERIGGTAEVADQQER